MRPASVLSLAIVATSVSASYIPDWKEGDGGRVMWDHRCDFLGQDLKYIQAKSDDCGSYCLSESTCSHWAWTDFEDGTCWLKKGTSGTALSDANVECGYVKDRFTPTNNAGSGDGIKNLITTKQFDKLFLDRMYSFYDLPDLQVATQAFSNFANSGDTGRDKKELAAFLAQTAHLTNQFNKRSADDYTKEYCNQEWGAPCAPGQRYYGRGPIQLTWNYNYVAAGKHLGVDLLNYPQLIGQDPVLAWKSALWFWMTPQGASQRIIHDVIHKDGGFLAATTIILGKSSCATEDFRRLFGAYKSIADTLGVGHLIASELC